jgi:serine/threonine protein kinase
VTSEDVEDPESTRALLPGDVSLSPDRRSAGRAPRGRRASTGEDSLYALPVGHRLQEFVIESIIGEGGFGIVYLARDWELDRVVAIKEFLPGAFASRTRQLGVSIKSEKYRASFEAGRRSFINEAKLLAQFEHPALVKVYRYWEENGTAYIVMPYYPGLTMTDWLHERQGKVPEAQLLRVVDALCEPLEMLHSSGVFHRDIAPDNIRILESGQPVLLDLGAARKIMADMTQTLTAFIKAGYAPIEQYAEATTLRQGPWSDVYALSAVLYYCVAGRAPPPAVARMVKDECVSAAVLGAGHYSAGFLSAIDQGLAVRPKQRTASVSEFRSSLGLLDGTTRSAPADQKQGSRPLEGKNPLRQGNRVPKALASASARRSRRPRASTWVIGIGTLVLVALTATRIYNQSRHDRPSAIAVSAPAQEHPAVVPQVAPPLTQSKQAQQAISDAQSRISHVKQIVGGQRDASPALFQTSDAALDDARLKLASGQAQEAIDIAQAAADEAARSAQAFVLGRELAYRQAADQRLKSGDIQGAESALNDAKAMRALGKRL